MSKPFFQCPFKSTLPHLAAFNVVIFGAALWFTFCLRVVPIFLGNLLSNLCKPAAHPHLPKPFPSPSHSLPIPLPLMTVIYEIAISSCSHVFHSLGTRSPRTAIDIMNVFQFYLWRKLLINAADLGTWLSRCLIAFAGMINVWHKRIAF